MAVVGSSYQPKEAKPKTKSRSGCLTCKKKRLKCDEQKPFCYNCIKKQIQCGGYATNFKWKTFKLRDPPSLDSKVKKESPPPEPTSRKPSVSSSKRSAGRADLEALLLEDHLELTALSVVGKSTKAIKLETELLAKGINPQSYLQEEEIRPTKKMRRSYSHNEIQMSPPVTAMHRSHSASTPVPPEELRALKSDFKNMNGLQSLAEAAVDEMRTRSPIFDTPEMQLAPYMSQKSPRNTASSTPGIDWNTVNHLHSPGAGFKDHIVDLNLTPSLSAIMNYVFTDGKLADLHGFPLGPSLDTPPSPLELSIVPTEKPTNEVPESPDGSCDLLYEVVLALRLLASPSISSGLLHNSLLRTSEHEQILYLYSTYTCGIMSIKSGYSENPWRSIYVPIANDYSYLFNSIASMTMFHLAGNAKLSGDSGALRSKGYNYMKKCILELATGLSRSENDSHNQFPADIALATCLNLAVGESWDTHISSGIAHLKGAKSMIQKVLLILKQYATTYIQSGRVDERAKGRLVLVSDDEWRRLELDPAGDDNEILAGHIQNLYIPRKLQLLLNEWIYFEVLSQMTSNSCQDDKGIDLVATITKTIQTTQKKRTDEKRERRTSEKSNSPTDSLSLWGMPGPSFFENLDTMLQNNDCVDPLLGCAQSLFSIMGKVANLISKVRKSWEADKKQMRNSLSNITLALELRQQLLDWKPNVTAQAAGMMNEQGEDSSWDIYLCVSTAEAYRYATLLYLHEAVPEVPLLSSHQLSEKIFVLLALIPSNLNLYIIHIFPLLVSSCEAKEGEEREWCGARWELLISRLWIGNIDRAYEVVKEVWRRKDEQRQLGADKPADPVSEEKGIMSKLHWSSVMREWGWEVLLA